MNGFKNWSVIPARTWRIRQADEGDGWLKIPAIPIPVGELTPAEDQKEAVQPAPVHPAPDAFQRRLDSRYDELKWLYCELYHGDMAAFDYFVQMLRRCWAQRKDALRLQDQRRENDPDWYRRRDLLGMMLYTNAFSGTLKGVEEKLPYIQ